MKREYSGTVKNNVNLFVGTEVEKTIAYEKRTLFVVGIQNVDYLEKVYEQEKCEHIFFGANHSLRSREGEWEWWESMITHFLKKGILCSLDIPYEASSYILDTAVVGYDNFIPQLRVPIPHIQEWPANTMVKIDDIGYDQTNPGVWCHSLEDLMDGNKFTCWDRYTKDKEIENE